MPKEDKISKLDYYLVDYLGYNFKLHLKRKNKL